MNESIGIILYVVFGRASYLMVGEVLLWDAGAFRYNTGRSFLQSEGTEFNSGKTSHETVS